MSLNQETMSQCNEFFEMIANENKSRKLEDAMESLHDLIEEDVDGWTNMSEQTFARAVQEGLEEIWDLISPEEKKANHLLEEYYDAIGENLQDYSGYDRHEYGRFENFLKRLDDDEYLETHEEEDECDDWEDDDCEYEEEE